VLKKQSQPIGGNRIITERRSKECGRLGGLNETVTHQCFFVSITDRSAAALTPIINQWIHPGTILSDCWKSSSLKSEGYFLHETVNHSIQFISESGAHINHIESTWKAFEKSLPHFSICKKLYESYFIEYCICCHFLDTAEYKLLEFLKLVTSVYCPPVLGYNCVTRRSWLLMFLQPTVIRSFLRLPLPLTCQHSTLASIFHRLMRKFDIIKTIVLLTCFCKVRWCISCFLPSH